MTTKLLLATALLAFATPAFALIGNNGDDHSISGNNSGFQNTGPITGSTINNGAGSGSTSADAIAAATAEGGAGGQGGKGGAGGNAQATNGDQKIEIKDRKQAPAVFAPGLANGYDCHGSASFGGSIAGIGIAGGSTMTSEACESVFLSRELERKGDNEGSWGVLCDVPQVRKHSKRCPQPVSGGSYGGAREERGFQNGSRKN